MRLYRLAIFIASILLVDAAYLSGNLSISYDPKPTLMFSTFAVKVDAKPNDKGCYIHKMAAGETCAYLIDKFTNVKSISNLNSWNKDTPGWEGCDNGHPWAGDEVCVSTGGYPDKRPSKNSDGSCKIHVIKSGESCGVLDKMYYLKPGDMYKFNEDNPNWVSCQDGRPWVGDRVCVSEGTPPSKDVTTNPDGSCYSHELKAGETCADMDKMYGLGPGDMYTFNENTPRWTNCQSLYEGLNVCVSKGTPAGNSVSKNKDGSCYVHTVSKGETCGSIDKLYKLNGGDNYKFNKNTYMWQGCKNNHPWVGDKICVTEGNPPKPPIDNKAECGPTAAGKEYDVKCPLNACCSQFGFCGLTSEFCKKTDSLTGAPGTAGCISNCGYGKQHTDTRSDFDKIVYWMDSDGKMASDPGELENDYDIMHYAFVNINSDFSIDDSKIKASDFLNLNMKRVASFGGWDFSTNPSTYKIFRNIVSSSGNREKFATNVVNFLKDYDLDGIDLDWEYPGAPDIPGIPADNPTNGKNYNELLKLIKSKLPSGKTLSIAIPASYWYLKNYPIKDMQANIDYQVFMTYDIHGTWDLDKDPHVKCHTNKTEVVDALKMLDKAGVQIGKTYGGIANYGRSYKLASDSCKTVGCPFTGGGDEGPITETAGVLALSEIDDIKSWATKNTRWTDEESQCDFMTYNDNSIVAWPKAGQRNSMEDMFHHSGLKGSVLWAGNYFKHKEYNPDIQNVNITSIFNDTYYINHSYDIPNSAIYARICNLKGDKIDWEACIYSQINDDINYPGGLYNTYMSIINKIEKNPDNYDKIYIQIKDYMLDIINGLASETKRHYDKNHIHDELKRRDDDKAYLSDYSNIFGISFPLRYDDFEDQQAYVISMLEGTNPHTARLNSRTLEILSIISGLDDPKEYFDINDEEYFARISLLLENEEFLSGSYPLIDADNLIVNNFVETEPETGTSEETYYEDYNNLDRMQGFVADGQQELEDLLDNIANSMALRELPRHPVYVINLNGESPGVAANAIRYINNNIDILTFGGDARAGPLMMRYVRPSDRISRNSLRSIYVAEELNYNPYSIGSNIRDLDEFPFNTLRLPNFDGNNRNLDPNHEQEMTNSQYLNMISVSQIDALDNRLDGMYWSRRVRGFSTGVSRSPITRDLVNVDYSNTVPNVAMSGSVSRLNFNDLVYIVIRIDTDEDYDLNEIAPPAKKKRKT